MNNKSLVPDLEIDVSNALPLVGDRKHIAGSADLVLREGYDMEFAPGKSVTWSLELRRIAGAVEVNGTVEGGVILQCYRCLEDFSYPFSLELREHALWLSDGNAEEIDADAPDYVVLDGMLDLEPVMRDAIALAFPVRRVCGEDCKGLCVKCGANLNVESCGCDTTPRDVRLSPLAELKKRLEQEAG
jgi:uncharacterized protein